jgi:Mrp family chromosome partitioning ATPase
MMRHRPPMLSIRDPELDLLYRRTVGTGTRVLAVTQSKPGEGTSTFALALARRGAAVGRRVVLIDANILRPTTSEAFALPRVSWSPTDERARSALIEVAPLGLSVLPAPIGVDPLAFRDPEAMRRMVEQDLRPFDLVVVDTSPVLDQVGDAIPAEVIGAAGAAVIVVVLAGVVSEHAVAHTIERLGSGGATVAGAVLNDLCNPSLADELGRLTARLAPLAPGLARRLQQRLQQSPLLAADAG